MISDFLYKYLNFLCEHLDFHYEHLGFSLWEILMIVSVKNLDDS